MDEEYEELDVVIIVINFFLFTSLTIFLEKSISSFLCSSLQAVDDDDEISLSSHGCILQIINFANTSRLLNDLYIRGLVLVIL